MRTTLSLAQRAARAAATRSKSTTTTTTITTPPRAAPLPYAPSQAQSNTPNPLYQKQQQQQQYQQQHQQVSATTTPERPSPSQPPPATEPRRAPVTVDSAEYKQAASKYTRAMIAMPILLLTSYVLYNRFNEGEEAKSVRGARDGGAKLVVLDR